MYTRLELSRAIAFKNSGPTLCNSLPPTIRLLDPTKD